MAPIGHISDKIYRAEGIYTERNNEDTICLNKHWEQARKGTENIVNQTMPEMTIKSDGLPPTLL